MATFAEAKERIASHTRELGVVRYDFDFHILKDAIQFRPGRRIRVAARKDHRGLLQAHRGHANRGSFLNPAREGRSLRFQPQNGDDGRRNDRDHAYKPFSSYKSSSVKGGSAGSSRRRPAG
jgi:hypothetical protein